MLANRLQFKKNFSELNARLQSAVEAWSERLIVKDGRDLVEVVDTAKQSGVSGFAVSVLEDKSFDLAQAKSFADKYLSLIHI